MDDAKDRVPLDGIGNGVDYVEVQKIAPPDGAKRRCCGRYGCPAVAVVCLVVLAGLLCCLVVAAVVWSPRSLLSSSTTAQAFGIRLPVAVVPTSYELRLRIDTLETSYFRGYTKIHFRVVEETEAIVLHSSMLDLGDDDRIRVRRRHPNGTDGEPIGIAHLSTIPENEQLVIVTRARLLAGLSYSVEFASYDGMLQDDLRGLYRSTYYDENRQKRFLVSSQLQSTDARRVFPCFDEPSMKATFNVTIVHRPGLTALSNMPRAEQNTVDEDDGPWVYDRFETTPVMSTYLLAFLVANYTYRETVVGNNLTIRIWARHALYNQTAHALWLSEKAYNFYGDYFGISEVVPKADHAAIPDFSAGAMENWGLVLYRESALLHDDTVSSYWNKYWVSLIIAHEIAHTWFGNMVTMAWWDDLWLNEGFANTIMYFALDHIYPSWKVYEVQLVTNIYPVMTKDALLTSHPISTNAMHPNDIALIFDAISYDKGMAVLRLLRGILGDDGFRNGLKRYIRKYQFSNADMSELWRTFEDETGHLYLIGDIMNTWTRQMGFPVVTVTRLNDTRYLLNQTRFLLNPEDVSDPNKSDYGYKWKIPFTYKVQGERNSTTKWMDLSSAYIDVPVGDSWILGNVDYMGFYRTNYDEFMWRRIIDQLLIDHKVFSASNRAGLISDAFNLARANQLSYDIVFNLTSYLHKEEEYVPWATFFEEIKFIDAMLSTTDSYGQLQKFVRNLVGPQYRRLGTSVEGDLLERTLRDSILTAACNVYVPEAVEWAKSTFQSWMKNGTRIPPDYALIVYSTGIYYGGESEWDFLWNASQTSLVVSDNDIMMTALATTQQPWLMWRYVRMSLDSSKIRTQDVRNAFRYYTSTALGRLVTFQFLLTNWIEFIARFDNDHFLIRDVLGATTANLNTEHDYLLLERIKDDHPGSGVAAISATRALSVVSSNINWMKLHFKKISEWLDANVMYGNAG